MLMGMSRQPCLRPEVVSCPTWAKRVEEGVVHHRTLGSEQVRLGEKKDTYMCILGPCV